VTSVQESSPEQVCSLSEPDRLIKPDLGIEAPIFVRGEGVELIDDKGRCYLDAASGVGVTSLGYGVTEVIEAMRAQAEQLCYLHALRFEAPPTRELADLVAAVTPGDLNHVFFVSGGSEANESAFKFARQYWLERGEPGRWKVVGRWPSFHGNTLATLSAGWHVARRRRNAPLLLGFPHVETPNCYRGCGHCRGAGGCTLACARELERTLIEVGPETVAAFIAEPVVGAAAGGLVPPPEYFPTIREICDHYGILFIADEVITGFGRLGSWFGVEHFDVQPDILVFAKGIAAGYAPLGGFATRASLIEPFLKGSGRFEHNFTYAGHPISAAVGAAVVKILRRDRLVERVARLEQRFFESLRDHLGGQAIVGDVRGMGFLAGVELVADRTGKLPFPPQAGISSRAASYCLEAGVIVYPCAGGVDGDSGDYLLVMPPFVTSEDELDEMATRIGRALIRLSGDLT
jgi:adenosylmethionine-8-amino-7-oxononanoate aminotransferase